MSERTRSSRVGTTHTLDMGGRAGKNRMHAATAFTDQANTWGAFLQKFQAGANFRLADTSDPTKTVGFNLANLTTATNRMINIPDAVTQTVPEGTSSGQIPIWDNALAKFVPGDPLVQGLFADGSTSKANPVLGGIWDGANLRAASGDSSGRANVNVVGTVPVSIASMPSTPVTGTVTATQATGTNLHMVCDSGCSSSAGFADNATFTTGTTAINPSGGLFDDTPPTAVATGKAAAARITNNRALHVNLRNQAGTEIGTASAPVQVTLANTGANATAVKVDNSGVTQPVSGTVSVNALPAGANVIGHVIADSGSTTAVTGNVATTAADASNVTLGAKADAKSTATDTTAVTLMQVLKEISAMEQAPASRAVTNAGTFAVQDATLEGAVTSSKFQINNAQVSGTAIDTNSGNKSAGTQRMVQATDQPALPAAGQGATGSAPPTGATQAGGLCSGATGGLLCGIPVADTPKAINISTATTTLIVTGVSGRQVRISSWDLIAAGADNVAWIEGTGATCGTGTAGMAGGTTAASGYNFAANGGMAKGSGLGTVLQTATAGDSVCIVTSANVQLSGSLMYAIY
jgi:hypothetical protein